MGSLVLIELDRFEETELTLGPETAAAVLLASLEAVAELAPAGSRVERVARGRLAVWCDAGSGRTLADALLERFTAPVVAEGRSHYTGVSVGIAARDDPGEPAERVLRRAGVAAQEARRRGGGEAVDFSSALNVRIQRRFVLEQDLRRALRRGEFTLHYQPIVPLRPDRSLSYESLARWQHPTGGTLAAGRFIGAVEDLGLIGPFGSWALASACRGLAGRANPLPVTVNVSAAQLERQDFVAEVLGAVDAAGIDIGLIRLELTERLLVRARDQPLATITALADAGVQLLVDDFGAGHSSLQVLHDLPIAAIKVDRGLLPAGPDRVRELALLRAVVALARELRLPLIGEGVETDEQLSLLRDLGFDAAQGFGIGRPRPGDQL